MLQLHNQEHVTQHMYMSCCCIDHAVLAAPKHTFTACFGKQSATVVSQMTCISALSLNLHRTSLASVRLSDTRRAEMQLNRVCRAEWGLTGRPLWLGRAHTTVPLSWAPCGYSQINR